MKGCYIYCTRMISFLPWPQIKFHSDKVLRNTLWCTRFYNVHQISRLVMQQNLLRSASVNARIISTIRFLHKKLIKWKTGKTIPLFWKNRSEECIYSSILSYAFRIYDIEFKALWNFNNTRNFMHRDGSCNLIICVAVASFAQKQMKISINSISHINPVNIHQTEIRHQIQI